MRTKFKLQMQISLTLTFTRCPLVRLFGGSCEDLASESSEDESPSAAPST